MPTTVFIVMLGMFITTRLSVEEFNGCLHKSNAATKCLLCWWQDNVNLSCCIGCEIFHL